MSLPGDTGRSLGDTPEAARVLFGDRLPQAVAFAEQLAGTGTRHGLIGPREIPRLWERHILNCAVVAEAMPAPGVRVIDVGSGAGLPGVTLAVARPDLDVHLVEPMQRRVDWLQECLRVVHLPNVTIHRARAEELHGRLDGAYVTARAVARLPVLLGWCAPLVVAGGAIVAMKGSSAAVELDEARRQLRRLQLIEPPDGAIRAVGADVLEVPTRVVVLTKIGGPRLTSGVDRGTG